MEARLKTKLFLAALAVATAASSPASAQKHQDGEFCQLQEPDCDRKVNALWVCRAIPKTRESDIQLYHWKPNGVCNNNLSSGDDLDSEKNKAKEDKNREAREKRNQKTIDEENKEREAAKNAAEKKAADDKKASDDKKAAADKKAADDKKKADDAKKAADKKAAEDKKKAADNKK
jgi:hypothetical protein